MKKEKSVRTKLLQVRLTREECEQIHAKFSASTCRKLSDYARKKLLDKPIRIYIRNQSLDDFMAEMILLRGELNAIENNYNQVVKRVHTLQHLPEVKTWLLLQEPMKQILFKMIEEIKNKIAQINDQWLQS